VCTASQLEGLPAQKKAECVSAHDERQTRNDGQCPFLKSRYFDYCRHPQTILLEGLFNLRGLINRGTSAALTSSTVNSINPYCTSEIC
jgi:hypothetical protein